VIGPTGGGKTHLTEEMLRKMFAPRHVLLITKKGFEPVPRAKIVQGKVVGDSGEIESGDG
jgi:hypothetical protein